MEDTADEEKLSVEEHSTEDSFIEVVLIIDK
jgi:hypothetical protein